MCKNIVFKIWCAVKSRTCHRFQQTTRYWNATVATTTTSWQRVKQHHSVTVCTVLHVRRPVDLGQIFIRQEMDGGLNVAWVELDRQCACKTLAVLPMEPRQATNTLAYVSSPDLPFLNFWKILKTSKKHFDVFWFFSQWIAFSVSAVASGWFFDVSRSIL